MKKRMIYTVLRIDEDIEFGCEERTDDSPVMAVVTLQDENGTEKSLRVADQFLYDSGINEGDRVSIDKILPFSCIHVRKTGRQENDVKNRA